MTEKHQPLAATDEQPAEHQRVCGEDPLLAGFAESQCLANRRQAVVTIVTSSTTPNLQAPAGMAGDHALGCNAVADHRVGCSAIDEPTAGPGQEVRWLSVGIS